MIKKINASLYGKLAKHKAVQARAYKALNAEVMHAKNELLDEFDNHPVTQEIIAGPSVTRSMVLPEGYGGLFSFLGFAEERDPIEPVRDELEKIKVSKEPTIAGDTLKFRVFIPSEERIEKVSPMDWESGRSWISAVTHGLSGFSQYIQRLGSGISGGGVQTKNQIRPNLFFRGTGYLFGMLGRFKRKIQ